MYQVIEGSTRHLKDVTSLIAAVNNDSVAGELFDSREEIFVTRAPGRLDVMGGIGDYSGSLVLELPIAEATLVALQKDLKHKIRIISLRDEWSDPAIFEMPLAKFESDGDSIEYDQARGLFQSDSDQHWAAYVAGVFLVLMKECGVRFTKGARVLIKSSVPEGKGVSSSAALEVAVMQAVCNAFGVSIEPRQLALLCQKVENFVVGAACGVMDQMTSACGEEGQLLALRCQPAELLEPVRIPSSVSFWGIDSGVRHSVSGSDYASVRVGAFMGYRMIAALSGITARRISDGLVLVEDYDWHGYLANLSPEEFNRRFCTHLPETISGKEFLERFGGTTDPVTQVEADREYPVRTAAAHPINENYRVNVFSQLLSCVPTEHQLELLGNLMYESHASYSACGLGSPGTDLLVDLVRETKRERRLYGAKITGGGSGGTVVVLGKADADEAIRAIAEKYQHRTGHSPHIFAGSSPGCARFGCLRLR